LHLLAITKFGQSTRVCIRARLYEAAKKWRASFQPSTSDGQYQFNLSLCRGGHAETTGDFAGWVLDIQHAERWDG
jgi:hypothetical protein